MHPNGPRGHAQKFQRLGPICILLSKSGSSGNPPEALLGSSSTTRTQNRILKKTAARSLRFSSTCRGLAEGGFVFGFVQTHNTQNGHTQNEVVGKFNSSEPQKKGGRDKDHAHGSVNC